VIAGDFDPGAGAQVGGEIFRRDKRGAPSRDRAAPASLAATKKLFHEDNFAQLPQLTLPGRPCRRFHPDGYALEILFALLTDGKETPLTRCWSTRRS
jgi:zinc protease